jgi:hypothetical protein
MTLEAKQQKEKSIIMAIEQASKGQQDERSTGKKNKGEFTKLLWAVEKTHDLEDNALDRHKFTIQKCAKQKNLSRRGELQITPMEEVEPTIIACWIKCSQIGQPLTHEQVLPLAILLVVDMDVAAQVISWKKKDSLYNDNQPLLGKKNWYNTFMSHHHDILWKSKARTKDINCQEWVMYENFSNMYKAVYKIMVMAGVAKKPPEAVWFDRAGHIVFNEEEAFGKKSKYFLEHPDYCIYIYKTGLNTTQKQGGHLGGQRYVLPVGKTEVGRVGAINDLHFTMLVFTVAMGVPIMVAVVLKSETCSSPV